MEHRTAAELEAGLDHIRRSPRDEGTLELIAGRPAVDERTLFDVAELDRDHGLVGDTWRVRGSRSTDDGSSDPDKQITVMNARLIALLAGQRDRWALAGDQLYIDFDVSEENVPPGTRLGIGSALIEVSDKPHSGCAKFSQRFGADALRFVNSEVGKELRLRGLNARVVRPGTVRRGDAVTKLA